MESYLRWSTTPGNGACPGVWLLYIVRLSKRKFTLPTAVNCKQAGVLLHPPPRLMLELGLASTCTCLVPAVTVAVSSYVHLPWYV